MPTMKMTIATEKRNKIADTQISSRQPATKKNKTTRTAKTKAKILNLTATGIDLFCEQSALNNCLEFVSRGTPNNSTLPMLNHVLLVADKEAQLLHLTTYNLEFGMTASLDAQVSASGSLTLPASAFGQVIRKFPPEEMRLKSAMANPVEQEGNAPLKATISTLADSNKRFEFMGGAAAEFPPLPNASQKLLIIPANLLIAQLDRSLFAASHDETKKILNGSHFRFDWDPQRHLDSLRTWTTDGHRLVFTQGLVENQSESQVAEPCQFTVPLKALRELERSLNPPDEVAIYFEPAATSETQGGIAMFEWGDLAARSPTPWKGSIPTVKQR